MNILQWLKPTRSKIYWRCNSHRRAPNGYDSFYRKLNADNENINPSQQPSATNTPSRFLSDAFTPPEDIIQTSVINKIKNVQKLKTQNSKHKFLRFRHCVKSVPIRSYSGQHLRNISSYSVRMRENGGKCGRE